MAFPVEVGVHLLLVGLSQLLTSLYLCNVLHLLLLGTFSLSLAVLVSMKSEVFLQLAPHSSLPAVSRAIVVFRTLLDHLL